MNIRDFLNNNMKKSDYKLTPEKLEIIDKISLLSQELSNELLATTEKYTEQLEKDGVDFKIGMAVVNSALGNYAVSILSACNESFEKPPGYLEHTADLLANTVRAKLGLKSELDENKKIFDSVNADLYKTPTKA